jgi:hypothetical protein
MGSAALSARDPKWVKEARVTGNTGEDNFASQLKRCLPSYYAIAKSTKLKVYNDTHGIIPDTCVRNTLNGKAVFVEKKTGNNGGNAHERVYKYLSPALQEKVSKDYDAIEKPFVFIFSGNTFQKKKYKDEFSLLLKGETYFVMEPGFTNIFDVADKIQELLA